MRARLDARGTSRRLPIAELIGRRADRGDARVPPRQTHPLHPARARATRTWRSPSRPIAPWSTSMSTSGSCGSSRSPTAQDVGKAIEPARGRGPDRGRHRAGPRAGPDGGDPARRRRSCATRPSPTTCSRRCSTCRRCVWTMLELADLDAPYGLRGVGEPPTISSTPGDRGRRARRHRARAQPRTAAPRGHRRSRLVSRERLIAVARGDAEPDLVIEGANVFCGFTKEWLETDVAVADGRIAGFGALPRAASASTRAARYLVPGIIDAHVHIESSKLMVDEFSRTLLAHGVTAIVCDPHEIANVLGSDGVHWLLDAYRGRRPGRLRDGVLVRARQPVRVAAAPAHDGRHGVDPAPPPRARHRRDDELPRRHRGRPVGAGQARAGRRHARRRPRARACAAPTSTPTWPPASAPTTRPSATGGAREAAQGPVGADPRGVQRAQPASTCCRWSREYGPEHCAFCTDDREPDFLVDEGHVNQMCRVAVEEGISPEDALLLATLHPARCHGLADRGAIAPGYRADLVLLPDLESFRPDRVWKDGRLVVDGGAALPTERIEVPRRVRQTVRNAPVGLSHLRIPSAGTAVRVIEIVPGQLITRAAHRAADGRARPRRRRPVARPGQDRRDRAPPRAPAASASASSRGFGLRSGAFATTVAHDAHNIVVVGIDDEDMRHRGRAPGRDRRRHRRERRRRRRRRAAAARRRPARRSGPPSRS